MKHQQTPSSGNADTRKGAPSSYAASLEPGGLIVKLQTTGQTVVAKSWAQKRILENTNRIILLAEESEAVDKSKEAVDKSKVEANKSPYKSWAMNRRKSRNKV